MDKSIINQVKRIVRTQGGHRERDILNHTHTIERGDTWNAEHKVVNVLEAAADIDGHQDGFAVDLVTRSIVG